MWQQLTPSLNKYLMIIYKLYLENKIVYQIDIAVALGYSKASVSRAIHLLESKGFIYLNEKQIELTKNGNDIIEEIYFEYNVFYKMLLQYEFNNQEANYYASQFISISDDYLVNKIRNYFVGNKYE